MIHGRPDKRTWQRALIVALCFVCGTSAVHAHATLLQTEPAAKQPHGTRTEPRASLVQ